MTDRALDDVDARVTKGYGPLPSDPPWLQSAWQDLGQREQPGPGNAPWLMKLRSFMPKWVQDWFVDDTDQAWCGLFVGAHLVKAGRKIPKNPLSARAYCEIGMASRLIRGAVVVLTRTAGGGHVGFLLDATPTTCTLLGGNQKDMVNVMTFDRGRVLACRWPS